MDTRCYGRWAVELAKLIKADQDVYEVGRKKKCELQINTTTLIE
jgi:hypothetical protein